MHFVEMLFEGVQGLVFSAAAREAAYKHTFSFHMLFYCPAREHMVTASIPTKDILASRQRLVVILEVVSE